MPDLALYEVLRARMNFDDAALNKALGIEKNTPSLWRRRNHIPKDKRELMMALLSEGETPQEEARRALLALDSMRGPLQRLLGPLPAHATKGGRRGR